MRSWWAGLERWDRLFVAGAIVFPLAFFVVPALSGHPIVSGDGMNQNMPLRELAGVDLLHGHLPLWDPYIWSGTPLLAGFNAGALFPATVLYSLLPATVAWSATEAAVFIVAGLGLYLFLRLHRLSPVASAVGAVTWCGFGFLGAQVVHIASVEGWGLVTWMLVALQRIAAGPRPHRARWAALFGLVLGLLILAGDPESITEGSMVAGIYMLGLTWRYRDVSIVGWTLVGSAAGLAIGGAQWIPGYTFARESQRGQAAYWFFNAGSVTPANIPLLFVPFLEGGYGRFGMPYYLGSYSLAELSGYAGLIGLGAVFSLFLLWRRDPGARDWRVWYLIGAVGLVLAMGGSTPVSHLMFHVPIYRLLRLPSRNLAWVDLAAAVLAGFWVDRVLLARLVGRSQGDAASGRAQLLALRIGSLVPVGVVVASLVAILAAGTTVIATLSSASRADASDHARGLAVTTGVQCLIALGFAVVVVCALRMDRRRVIGGLVVVLFADLFFYGIDQGWLQAPTTRLATGATMQKSELASFVASAGGGRFAIFDPDRYDIGELVKLDEPDINILQRVPSVAGYGSVVPAAYANATSTHQQLTLSVNALTDGTFARLGLTVLLSPTNYFVSLVSRPPLTSAQEGFRLAFPPPPPPASQTPPVEATGTIPAGEVGSWFWGQQSGVVDLTVSTATSRATSNPAGSGGFQVGLVESRGAVRWLDASRVVETRVAGDYIVRGSHTSPLSGVGMAVRPTGPWSVTVRSIGFDTSQEYHYLLDGALTQAVRPGSWVDAGSIGEFSAFVDASAAHADHIVPESAGTVTAFAPQIFGNQSYLVRAHLPSTMVRSVSYSPGWRATLVPAEANGANRGATPTSTRTVSESVSADGLVQSIRVPAGTWLVTFSYHPPEVAEGLLAALGGLVVLAALVWFRPGVLRRHR